MDQKGERERERETGLLVFVTHTHTHTHTTHADFRNEIEVGYILFQEQELYEI